MSRTDILSGLPALAMAVTMIVLQASGISKWQTLEFAVSVAVLVFVAVVTMVIAYD
jgi:lipopolysaccharide export LptBFGC system permease protein LptF